MPVLFEAVTQKFLKLTDPLKYPYIRHTIRSRSSLEILGDRERF